MRIWGVRSSPAAEGLGRNKRCVMACVRGGCKLDAAARVRLTLGQRCDDRVCGKRTASAITIPTTTQTENS